MKQPDRRLEARHAVTVHLRDVDDDTFQKCYDDLMRPSFSEAELMTFDESSMPVSPVMQVVS